MAYFRYRCPKCGKYFGGPIPTDDLPSDRLCIECGGSSLSICEKLHILFYECTWVTDSEFNVFKYK